MAFVPISWKRSYVVAVTRGRTTRYFYGTTLKEAVTAARGARLNGVRLKPGDGFAYAKFERGAVQWAELGKDGKSYIHNYGPMRKGKAA